MFSGSLVAIVTPMLRDGSLDIHVARHGPLTPEELSGMDAVFTFQAEKLVELK